MIKIENFSKKYINADFYSAREINLVIEDGEVLGLVGSNGAGKSTLIKCITGILPFHEGKITIDGFDVSAQPEQAKRRIGYVPDNHVVYEKLTGREYVNYIGSLYGVGKREKTEALEKYAKLFSIENALDTQISNYSHGMKQKICLIGSLVHHPSLWILDEPMVGLDPQTMAQLCREIRAYADEGNSVLFSSHNLDVVKKTCDKAAFIKKGELAAVVDLRKERGFDLDGYFMRLNGEGQDV